MSTTTLCAAPCRSSGTYGICAAPHEPHAPTQLMHALGRAKPGQPRRFANCTLDPISLTAQLVIQSYPDESSVSPYEFRHPFSSQASLA